MGVRLRRNPLFVLGIGITLGMSLTAVVTDVAWPVAVVQSSLPVVLGLMIAAYGWTIRSELTPQYVRSLLIWIVGGTVGFFLIGYWFGFLSRSFDTSFVLAVISSLCLGSVFGAVVGVYAGKLKKLNAELEATNERLRAANEELERSNERLEEFAGVVSHDLRNPLNVAKGRLTLATEQDGPEHLDEISTALDRMDEIIDDVLTLVREEDSISEAEPVDLETVAVDAWNNVATGDATLTVDGTTTFEADRDRLLRLFENLFRNAHEHAGSDVAVRVGLEDDCLYVEDDGPGVPPDQTEQLFESGYTTNENGTGFGLSIVSQIVEAHGWQIDITDSADGGTRFEISGVSVTQESTTVE